MTSQTPTRPEDERLSVLTLLGYGTQHILSMFGGVIAVPIIVGTAAGLSGPQIATLLSCAITPRHPGRQAWPSTVARP